MDFQATVKSIHNPQRFVEICNALLAAEHKGDFIPIDDNQRDKGNDGYIISQKRLLSMHCFKTPNKHKKDQAIIVKATKDLKKIDGLRKRGWDIENWTFLVGYDVSENAARGILTEAKKHQYQLKNANYEAPSHLADLVSKHHDSIVPQFPEFAMAEAFYMVKDSLQKRQKPITPQGVLKITVQKGLKEGENHLEKGVKHYYKKQYHKAIVEFKKAKDILKPFHEDALFNLAFVYSTIRDYKNASFNYKEYLTKFNPYDYNAWNNLGNCFTMTDKFRAAYECYKLAITLKKDFNAAKINIAILIRKNIKLVSKQTLEEAVKIVGFGRNKKESDSMMGYFYFFQAEKEKDTGKKVKYLEKSNNYLEKTQYQKIANVIKAVLEQIKASSKTSSSKISLRHLKNARKLYKKNGMEKSARQMEDAINLEIGQSYFEKVITKKTPKTQYKYLKGAKKYLSRVESSEALQAIMPTYYISKGLNIKSDKTALSIFKKALGLSKKLKIQNQINQIKSLIHLYKAKTSKSSRVKNLQLAKIYAKKCSDNFILEEIKKEREKIKNS